MSTRVARPVLPSDPLLRRAKLGVTAAFVAHAVLFSSWVAHIPQVKAELELSNGQLGAALFGAPLGSVISMVLSHWALPRWGSHRLVPINLAGYAASGLTVGLAGSGRWLFAALALWGMFQGGLDVAMNTQAGTVERLAATPLMARFHGMWSVGAFLGALIGTVCVTAGVRLTTQLAVLGAIVLIVAAALNLGVIADRHAGAAAEATGRPGKRAWMTTTVAILGAVAFISLLCEGAAADWSANYLHDVLGDGPQDGDGIAGLGFAGFTLAMVVTRLGGPRLQSRIASRRLLPVLAMLAAAGMTVALISANPVLSVLGFATLGAGVALLVPTAFSAAYSATTAGSAIALVAAIGWLGYLMGPPLIGFLADLIGLPGALVTIPLMISIAAVAIHYTDAFEAADQFHRDAVTSPAD